MKDLILHPKTKQQLELIINRQPQALIMQGRVGVGLYTIMRRLALEISTKHDILEIVPDEKGVIKIDTIRRLYGQTRTKRKNKMIILIDNADAMQAPAQNALLKLLEDTPKNSMFLLSTHLPQLLLPTIRSRSQEIELLPVSIEQTHQLIKEKLVDKTKQPQLLFLAQGLPAELYRLVSDKEYLELRENQMRMAKDFLSKNLYEKLVIIYKLPGDRSQAYTLLQDIIRIIETTLKSMPDPKQASLLQNLLNTEQKLHSDGHVRTQLLALALKIN